MFLGKGILEICSQFTGEHPCQSAISIKLLCSFIEITFRHGCSPVNLLHIFKNLFIRMFLNGCFCKLKKEYWGVLDNNVLFFFQKQILWGENNIFTMLMLVPMPMLLLVLRCRCQDSQTTEFSYFQNKLFAVFTAW